MYDRRSQRPCPQGCPPKVVDGLSPAQMNNGGMGTGEKYMDANEPVRKRAEPERRANVEKERGEKQPLDVSGRGLVAQHVPARRSLKQRLLSLLHGLQAERLQCLLHGLAMCICKTGQVRQPGLLGQPVTAARLHLPLTTQCSNRRSQCSLIQPSQPGTARLQKSLNVLQNFSSLAPR